MIRHLKRVHDDTRKPKRQETLKPVVQTSSLSLVLIASKTRIVRICTNSSRAYGPPEPELDDESELLLEFVRSRLGRNVPIVGVCARSMGDWGSRS